MNVPPPAGTSYTVADPHTGHFFSALVGMCSGTATSPSAHAAGLTQFPRRSSDCPRCLYSRSHQQACFSLCPTLSWHRWSRASSRTFSTPQRSVHGIPRGTSGHRSTFIGSPPLLLLPVPTTKVDVHVLVR